MATTPCEPRGRMPGRMPGLRRPSCRAAKAQQAGAQPHMRHSRRVPGADSALALSLAWTSAPTRCWPVRFVLSQYLPASSYASGAAAVWFLPAFPPLPSPRRYKWYRSYEVLHFPDPMGMRDKLERYSLGLYPASE